MGSPKAGNVLINDSGYGNLRPDWPDQCGNGIGSSVDGKTDEPRLQERIPCGLTGACSREP